MASSPGAETGSNFLSRAAARAKKDLRTSSLRWASPMVSPLSAYVIGFSQGAIANMRRSTRGSILPRAFLQAGPEITKL